MEFLLGLALGWFGRILYVKARWRSGPATAAQRAFLSDLGSDGDSSRLTRRTASAEIDRLRAERDRRQRSGA